MATAWRNGRLQTGKLRHKIDIVKVSPVQDSTGGINLSIDTVYANVWASVEALSANETMGSAQSEVSTKTHQIIIRYIGAAPSWQANYNYVTGQLVKDSNGNLQQAQADGTSGPSVPVWGPNTGDYTGDGNPSTGETWKNLGVAPPYTGVTAAMQIWFQSRQFQIKSVQNPFETTKLLCLLCEEINDSRQQITNQPADLG